MIFVEDLLDNILSYIYFKQYHKIDTIKIVSKLFYKSMLTIFNKYNIKETLLIATNIKCYRPEVEQIEHINNDFIIFDNFNYVNNWINSCNDKDRSSYHSYEPFLTKDIITITNNKLIQNEHIIKYNYADINSGFDLTNIDELNFTEYIIYYFYENCIYCYVINFIILPYFDERILQKKIFLNYKKIKINTFYEHNITQINGINF